MLLPALNTFTPSTTILSSSVNANFAAIVAWANGNIGTANLETLTDKITWAISSNVVALDISSTSTAGVYVASLTGVLAATKSAFDLQSNAAQTAGRALAYLNLSNASSTIPGLLLNNAGTGIGLSITQSGAGSGLKVAQAANAKAIEVTNSGTSNSIDVTHSGSGSAVKITDTGASGTNAALEVVSTVKGSIPAPKMTGTQRDAISSPTVGLRVFNTTAARPEFYTGSFWAAAKLAIVAKTANYTLTQDDDTVTGDTSGGAFTLTLPTAVNRSGSEYTLKKTDSSANVLTIATTSAQTIDGASNAYLGYQNDSITLVSDGTNWRIASRAVRKQQVIGSAQTSNSTTASTSFTSVANGPTVSITPLRTGLFKVYGVIHISNSVAGSGNWVRVIASSGSPSVQFSQEAYCDGPNTNFVASLAPYTIVQLTANTAYTFRTEFKVSANTLTLQNAVPTNGHVLVAEEV
jgi:hypothetical protein